MTITVKDENGAVLTESVINVKIREASYKRRNALLGVLFKHAIQNTIAALDGNTTGESVTKLDVVIR